jgi:hypothetical protein
MNSHNYKLNTLLRIYNVFYIRLLKLVKLSLLFSQIIYKSQLFIL